MDGGHVSFAATCPKCLLQSLTYSRLKLFSSLLSDIRVVSSACLRLLIFLLAILIPACGSSILSISSVQSLSRVHLFAKYRASLFAMAVLAFTESLN